MQRLSWLDPRKSSRARLVLGIGILAIVLSQISAYLTRGQFVDQIKADRGLLLAEIAHQMMGEMDKGIFERLREIQIVASLPLLSDPKVSFAEKQRLLEKLQDTYRNYAWIGFTDAEGNILVGTHDLLEGKNVANRDWFINGAKGPAVGDVHDAFLLAKLLPKPENDFLPLRLLDISAPIRDKNGNLLGVLCGHLSWDWSHQVKNTLLAPLKAHTKTDILIVGKEGQVLLGTPELHKLAHKLNTPSVTAAHAGGNAFLTEAWPDGRVYLTGYAASQGHADFPGLGWRVLVRQPVDQAFAVADLLQRRGLITSLLSALAFGIVLWLMAGRLIKPMRRIATAAARIRAGEENEGIPVIWGADEIAQLSQSLSDMVQTLEAQKAELTDKNQRLQLAAQVFSSNTEGIIITDAEERILSVNEAFSEISGYSPEEVVGKTPRVLHSGHQDKSFYESMWADLKRDGHWQGEIRNRHKSGEIYIEWLHISQVRDPIGMVTHYIAIISNITQRKQTEEQVRKLAQVVEQSPESIFITDLNGEIEYVNEAVVQHSGYSKNELIGQNPRILQSGKTPRASYDALWDALTHGRTWQGEFFNRRKDGTEYVEFAIISPILQADGQASHYVAVKEDITERKQTAQELDLYRHHLEELVAIRTQELEAAHAEAQHLAEVKGNFLANMSHEIRTPMNAVLGMAKIGLRLCKDEKSREPYQHILESGQHLLGVINDILDFSKIESGKLSVEAHPFRLDGVVNECMEMLTERAHEKGLALEVSVADDLPEWVRGDPLRLKQILVNLLGNAVKFTQQGEVTLRVAHEGADTYFKVIDTGIGMTEEQLSRLFTPFEQADSSTTRKYGGTGLGLNISRQLAHLMGGEISVESHYGEGSAFTLRLPMEVVEPPTSTHILSAQATHGPRLTHLRVLAAEDMEVNRLVLEDLLVHEGAYVTFAENGQQALDLLEEMGMTAFDVVLMDVQMPVMDGLEATRRIREIAPALPVIGLTAHAMAEERERCLAAGMVERVTKPIETDELIQVILRYVDLPPAPQAPAEETQR